MPPVGPGSSGSKSSSIGASAAQTLAEALSHENRTLTSLELSHNPLGRRGTEQVMAALTNNPTLTSIGLQHTLAGLGDIRDKLGGGEQSERRAGHAASRRLV